MYGLIAGAKQRQFASLAFQVPKMTTFDVLGVHTGFGSENWPQEMAAQTKDLVFAGTDLGDTVWT